VTKIFRKFSTIFKIFDYWGGRGRNSQFSKTFWEFKNFAKKRNIFDYWGASRPQEPPSRHHWQQLFLHVFKKFQLHLEVIKRDSNGSAWWEKKAKRNIMREVVSASFSFFSRKEVIIRGKKREILKTIILNRRAIVSFFWYRKSGKSRTHTMYRYQFCMLTLSLIFCLIIGHYYQSNAKKAGDATGVSSVTYHLLFNIWLFFPFRIHHHHHW